MTLLENLGLSLLLLLVEVGWLTQSLPPALLAGESEAALQALHKLPVAQRSGAQVPDSSVPRRLAAARRQPGQCQRLLGPWKLLLLLLLLLAEAGGQEGPPQLRPGAAHLGLLWLLGWGWNQRCMTRRSVK